MRCQEFEDMITEVWVELKVDGFRGSRDEVRRKTVEAVIARHGYFVLIDDQTEDFFDAATGAPRPNFPYDLHPQPDLRPIDGGRSHE